VTTVPLKASLGSEQYQLMNSRMAWSYERFELEDVRLFKTADFDCSRSGNLRTVFGTRLRLLFAIGSGLRCRGEKHDPVPDLLTSHAFLGTNPKTQPILLCPLPATMALCNSRANSAADAREQGFQELVRDCIAIATSVPINIAGKS
jgi:hypothetical protein